jgi:cytosine/uracil/thiamine/allantoin permease
MTIGVSIIPALGDWAAFSWPIGVVSGFGVYYALSNRTKLANAAPNLGGE